MSQMEEGSVIYGQRMNKSRCLTSVIANTEHNRFLVGTHSLLSENEVHLIEYSEENRDIICLGLFKHKYEIWSITPCPTDESLFFTVYNTGKEYKASLWQLPEIESHEKDTSDPLKHLLDLENHADPLHCVLWSTKQDRVLTVDGQNVREWKINQSMNTSECSSTYNVGRRVMTAKWDPHHPEIVAVGARTRIQKIDLRTKKIEPFIKHAHDQSVRDIEFNPYNPYHLATCGDDCKIRIWDMRKPNHSLKILSGHSHWVYNVKFNPLHDELLLSSSADSLVKLWYLPTVSSKEMNIDDSKDRDEEEDEEDILEKMEKKDCLIKSIDEHEESVYSIAWSSCSSWIFGSVSYDGRVLIHTVPTKVKNTILH